MESLGRSSSGSKHRLHISNPAFLQSMWSASFCVFASCVVETMKSAWLMHHVLSVSVHTAGPSPSLKRAELSACSMLAYPEKTTLRFFDFGPAHAQLFLGWSLQALVRVGVKVRVRVCKAWP